MERKRILVSGGLGYIGSHTCVDLIHSGFDVHIIDNLSNSRIETLDSIHLISGQRPAFTKLDLRDAAGLRAYFSASPKFDAIIHFAALKSVVESVRKPLLYFENNVTALLNLLSVSVEFGVTDFVFSSSCTIYGQPDVLPVDEAAPFNPAASPYGETKQIAEKILKSLTDASLLRVISLRYFNPIGAHESGLIGEWNKGEPDNLVPYITQTAAGLRSRLRVFGSDYNTSDGTAIRDYIHVCDLAEAHVAALGYFPRLGKDSFKAFNIGTGKGCSVLEVIASFERVAGMNLPYEFVAPRPGDIEMIYADPALAKQELGWVARRGLDEMMASAWQWQKSLLAQKTEHR